MRNQKQSKFSPIAFQHDLNGMGRQLTRRALLTSAGSAAGLALLPNSASAEAGNSWATSLTTLEASTYVRRGDVSAERYVSALLEQAGRVRGLNIFISGETNVLLEAARKLDRRRRAGDRIGALAGVPLLIKDNIETSALPTTAGTPALINNRPVRDAAALARLFLADAFLFGKTNMDELGFDVTGNNAAFGAVHNPHAPDRIPGGSSSGTAAGIAARVAPVGLGTDTGGSCRIPASLCGIVGFRPTIGRYPAGGTIPTSRTRDTIAPMGRSVSDVALLDTIMSGQPILWKRPLRGLRLGLPFSYFWSDLDPATEAVAKQAILRLQETGVEFVAVDLPGLPTLLDQAAPILTYEAIADLRLYLSQSRTGLTVEQVVNNIASPGVKALYTSFLQSGEDQAAYQVALQVYRPRLQALYTDCFRQNGIEALCYPATPITASVIGQQSVMLQSSEVPVLTAYARNGMPAAVAGLPALVVPAGLSSSYLPVGLEFGGPIGSDSSLLSIGLAVEKSLPQIQAPRLDRVAGTNETSKFGR